MSNNAFFSQNLVFFEMMWQNIIESSRPQMRIWRMGIVRWTPKGKNAHSGYVILFALPQPHNGCSNAPQHYVSSTFTSLTEPCPVLYRVTHGNLKSLK